jgi:hypothetical protein
VVVVVSVIVVVVVLESVDNDAAATAVAGGASASISNNACSIALSIRSGFAPVPTRGRGRCNTSHCQIAAAVSRSVVVRLVDDDNASVINGGGDDDDDDDIGVCSDEDDDDCDDAGLLVVAIIITIDKPSTRPRWCCCCGCCASQQNHPHSSIQSGAEILRVVLAMVLLVLLVPGSTVALGSFFEIRHQSDDAYELQPDGRGTRLLYDARCGIGSSPGYRKRGHVLLEGSGFFDPHIIFPSFLISFLPSIHSKPTMMLSPKQQEQQHQQEHPEQQQLAEKDEEEEEMSCAFLLDDLERIVVSSPSTTARQMAALRLHHDGTLADRLVRLWLAQQQEYHHQQRTALLGSDDNDHDNKPMVMNDDNGRLVRRRSSSWRMLAILDHIIRCDPTLAEEIVCHSLFRTLLNGHHGSTVAADPTSSDSDDDDDDEDEDDEELIYSIMAFQKQFPTTQYCCGFTRSELRQRLPISLSFLGGAGGGGSSSSTTATAARDVRTTTSTKLSILIQQVTHRQTAQSDVGFGKYKKCYRGGSVRSENARLSHHEHTI